MKLISELTPYQVATSSPLYQVMAQLITNDQGIVFCIDQEDRFFGAISLGDIKRFIASNGDLTQACEVIANKSAKRIMQSQIEQAQSLFTQSIRCIPVLNDSGQFIALATGMPEAKINQGDCNLNIGSAQYHIAGFTDLDLPSDWYDKKRTNTFIPFDIRTDKIPFDNNSVSNIYCSHVIEHLEDEAVTFFIENCFRSLKSRGVLRIACPDAEHLWQVSQFKNDYWNFMKYWFDNPANSTAIDFAQVTKEDQLISALATEKCRHYVHKKYDFDPQSIIGCDYAETMARLKNDLNYNVETPNNHINQWDFARLKALGDKAGFSYVIRSKYQGCVSSVMQGEAFDKTWPRLSLYVDFVK